MAAPATVGGVVARKMPLGNREGAGCHITASQETGRRVFLKPTVGGTVRGLIMTALATSIPFIDSRRALGLAAFVLGFSLFLAAGFAWPEMVHNATHDVRHSFGLPCH